MSSREIAELTDKRHGDVIRDIRSMLDDLGKDDADLRHQFTEEKDARGYTAVFHLNRELTDCLLTGYSAVARMRVIKRWHSLEETVAPARLTTTSQAVAAIEDAMKVASLFGVPAHYAQAEAVKLARNLTGVDFAPMLPYSPAQDNIAYEDIMLEPTELGRKFGLSAIATNARLRDLGLQVKLAGEWVPTLAAEGMSTKHGWENHGKTGYNLKWRVAKVAHLLQEAA